MRRYFLAVTLAIRNLALHDAGFPHGPGPDLRRLVGRRDAGHRRGASLEAQRQIAELGATNVILQSKKPIEEVKKSQGGNDNNFVFAFGLTHDDFDRIVSTIPTVVGATPIREFRQPMRHLDLELEGASSGRPRLPPADRPADGPGPLPDRHRPARLRQRHRDRSESPRNSSRSATRWASRSGSAASTSTRYRGDRAQGPLGGDGEQPRGPGLQQGRLHPHRHRPRPVRRRHRQPEAGELHRREDRAEPDHRRRRRDGQRQADVPGAREPAQPVPPEARLQHHGPPRAAREGRGHQAHLNLVLGPSPRFRSWSAASAS